jgi:hypothetical protein
MDPAYHTHADYGYLCFFIAIYFHLHCLLVLNF